jgi:hypothetical protein
MKKIVINKCFGGFSLSDEACQILGVEHQGYFVKRDWQPLIDLIEEKGSDFVSGSSAELAIVEIPDDVDYGIEEYDGNEWIAESHRTWS